jgi:hypothetical protein
VSGLRELDPRPGYDSGDGFLNQFLIPALERSYRYNRSVGYFRSSALAVAARGLSHFIAGGGHMRLVVGTDLTEEDCQAMSGGIAVPDTLADRLAVELVPADDIEQHRLEVLAWLAHTNRLLVKVAIPVDREGRPVSGGVHAPYFHEKIGVLRDRDGEGIVFQGSVNETAAGWDRNFESFSVHTSWDPDPRHYDFWVERFEDRWAGRVKAWRMLDLPQVLRDRLLEFSPAAAPGARDPEEPPDLGDPGRVARFLLAAPTLVDGEQLSEATSAVTLFPHQRQVVERLAGEYPRSWLVADEVGLGKTISAGLALRRLLLSGDVRRVLILAPASVCRQWQDELFEKFGLWVDRYERGIIHGAHHEDQDVLGVGRNPYAARDLLIASSHLARRADHQRLVLEAGPWDLLIVDEAHHARRTGTADPTRYRPGRLLELLDRIGEGDLARATWLLTATPMQVDPIELRDLLTHVGLSGPLARWTAFERWYRTLAEVDDERVDWHWLAITLQQSPPPPPGSAERWLLDDIGRQIGPVGRAAIERFGTSGEDTSLLLSQLDTRGLAQLRRWLGQVGPVGRFVTRHSRATLKAYRDAGLLSEPVADRNVEPVLIDFNHDEAILYKELDQLIDRLLEASGTRRGAGFFLTIYRRRLTSSWAAIRRTLEKRLIRETIELDEDVDEDLVEEAEQTVGVDINELESLPLSQEDMAEISRYLADIDRLNDSKFDRLRRDLDTARGHGQAAIVFTQFTDTLISLRDRLKGIYQTQLATFTGDGGRIFAGLAGDSEWERVSKQELVDAIRSGRVTVLLANDAASEGLNLQACSWLINYDMPWNPMRAEQRIGRIDRIGQQAPVIQVRNYFIPGTVEERVYELLADRIDSFTDLLGNLQPILGHVENAVRSVFQAPRAERAAATAEALKGIDRHIDELRSSGVDLSSEDPMPVPEYPDPPVTLEQLRSLLQDHLRVQIGRADERATFDPHRVSRDPKTWCALATYGHPRLEQTVGQVAASEAMKDALVIRRATAVGITRSAAVRADRTPPAPLHFVEELGELSDPVSTGDAELSAFTIATKVVLERAAHTGKVEAGRAVRREGSIRQRFVRLARRTIAAERARARLEGRRTPEPMDAWSEFQLDADAWRYAEAFRQQLGVDLDEVLHTHETEAASMTLAQARIEHRSRTAGDLHKLMDEWRSLQQQPPAVGVAGGPGGEVAE